MSGFTLQLHRPPIDHPHGLHGAFDTALYALAQDGVALDRDAAMVATGLAFRTYQFRPADNWAWLDDHPEARWRWATLMVESYGAFEALAAHANRDLCWYNALKPVEWLGLVTYELEAGRVPIVQVPESGLIAHAGDHPPTTVWALHAAQRGDKSWANAAAAALKPDHTTTLLHYPALDAHPATGEAYVAGMLVARPAAESTPATRLPALWRDALSFAIRHAQGTRELEFRQELYYASGAGAWRATLELLDDDADDPMRQTYWQRWAAQVAAARGAAARMLPAWDAHTSTPLDGDAASLSLASDAFQAVAAIMAATQNDPTDAVATRTAVNEAAAQDKRGFDALAKAFAR